MAKSKPEPIDIRISKQVPDKTPDTKALNQSGDDHAFKEEPVEKDGGFSRAMHPPGQAIKPGSTQESAPQTPEKSDVSAPEDTVDADGGHSQERPDTPVREYENQETEKDAQSETKAPAEGSLKHQHGVLPEHTEDTGGETDIYDDFYTSKLNVNQEDLPKPRKANLDHSSSSMHALISVRFWFLLFIFIITSLAGFVMLHQLEQAQTGAGIIFEWFEWL